MDATGSGFTATVPVTVPDFTEDIATEKSAECERKSAMATITGNALSFGMNFGEPLMLSYKGGARTITL